MRRQRGTNYFLILLSYLAVTFCFACATVSTTDEKKQGEIKDGKVVARVNGKVIYEDQLAPDVKKSLKKFRKYGMRNESPEVVTRFQKKVLDKVIEKELIYQESQKLTIENLDEKIEQKLKKMKRRYQTEKQLENHLKTRNLTAKDLRESLKKRI